MAQEKFQKDFQFYRFAAYGFLKNIRLFEPFLILFFRSQGLDFFQIGILYSVREVSTNLLEVPTGVLADIIGRRLTMVLSMISYIVSFSIFFILKGFWAYAVAMTLFGLGDALRSGTHKALILAYLKIKGWDKYKVEYYGATRSWSQRGSALNAILAGLLVLASGDYRWVFGASLIPYVINLINLATYPAELDTVVKKKKKQQTLKEFRAMITQPRYLKALMNSSLFMGVFKGTKDYLQPVLKSIALGLPVLLWLSGERRTAIVVGLVYSVIYLINAQASQNAYRIKDMVSGRLGMAMNITYIIGAASVMLAGITYQWNWTYVAVLMFMFMYVMQNIRRPLAVAYISDTIPEGTMATGLSVESSLRTFTAMVIAPVLGYLADHIGVGYGLATVGAVAMLLTPVVWLSEPKQA